MKISVADYLAGELVRQVRHEYVDGEIYAMPDSSRRHNLVAGQCLSRLHEHLRGKVGEIYFVAVKLYVAAVNCFYYPDLAVVCDPTANDPYFFTRPVLLVEVLSPGTARIDRREKLSSYQTLPSLREYLILAQDRVAATLHRRHEAGEWEAVELTEDDELWLASVDLRLPLAELYAGLDWDGET